MERIEEVMEGASENEQSTPTTNPSVGNESSQCTTKGKKLTSFVWQHMRRETSQNGIIKATCNHCKAVLSGKSANDTSHLKPHLESCAARRYHDIMNFCVFGPAAACESAVNVNVNRMSLSNPVLTLEAIRQALSVMLVSCALPFTLVEAPGFKYFLSTAVPQFDQVSRHTIQRDIMGQYKEQKMIVAQELQNAPSRICLTTDNWRSEHNNDEFMCVTAHWIDKSWKLQKRIIKFDALFPLSDGASLADEILLCLGEWKITDKVFSFTVDNASYNDTMIASIKSHLLRKQALVLHGEFFHVRCSCHIINLVVQAGLKVIDDVVLKIRSIVSHLKHSLPKQKKFYEIASTNFSLNTSKRVRLDTPTRWNSTYLMLDHFVYFRDAIESFVSKDSYLREYRLSGEDWEKVIQLRKFLSHFYDVTNKFSASNTPTANIYFRGVWKLHKVLLKVVSDPPSILSRMVDQMEIKFEKYWDEYNLLLSCAATLDPRLKLEGVGFSYEMLFGDTYAKEMLKKIRAVLIDLLDEYKVRFAENGNSSRLNSASSSYKGGSNSISDAIDCDGSDSELDEQILRDHMNKKKRIEIKCELDLYLDDKNVDFEEDLDILQFWKRESKRYPILSTLARDILCVPISTVPSESAFSLGKKIITSCRSSLFDETTEALACYEDWLRGKGLDQPGQTMFKIGDVSAGYVSDAEGKEESIITCLRIEIFNCLCKE